MQCKHLACKRNPFPCQDCFSPLITSALIFTEAHGDVMVVKVTWMARPPHLFHTGDIRRELAGRADRAGESIRASEWECPRMRSERRPCERDAPSWPTHALNTHLKRDGLAALMTGQLPTVFSCRQPALRRGPPLKGDCGLLSKRPSRRHHQTWKTRFAAQKQNLTGQALQCEFGSCRNPPLSFLNICACRLGLCARDWKVANLNPILGTILASPRLLIKDLGPQGP